ncbi:MAG TPA: lipid II flippase MurJ [Candidatus Angelobacter sp.]
MKLWFFKSSAIDSPNRRIFRAALVVGLLTLLVKCGATVKELVVARWFGRSDALDAFLIAFLLPSFILGLVMGALEFSLIPTFIRTRQNEGVEATQKLFAGVMLLSLLLLAITTLLLGLLAPYYLPYLGSGFSAEKLRLTRELFYVLLPFVLFNGIVTCCSAVLNAGERFALPAFTPIVTPLLTIVLIELGAAQWGTFCLAGGLVAGSILEAAVLVASLPRQGLHFSLRWTGMTPALRGVLGQYAPMLAGAFLVGGTAVVDQSMAAMLPPGSVAALSYAGKVIGVILAIGSAALGVPALSYFSKMAAANDWQACRHTINRYSLLIVMTTLPFTVAFIAFSRPLVRMLFQRGAFTAADTELVSWVQICFAIQIPFYIWARLFIRFVSSLRQNHILMYASAITLVLDIVFNLIFMRWWGVAGIALSTSVVSIVVLAVMAVWSFRLLQQRASIGSMASAQSMIR